MLEETPWNLFLTRFNQIQHLSVDLNQKSDSSGGRPLPSQRQHLKSLIWSSGLMKDWWRLWVFLSLLQSLLSACVHISSPHILHADIWHWLQHRAARFSLEQPGPERQNTHQFYSNVILILHSSIFTSLLEELRVRRWVSTGEDRHGAHRVC